MDRFHRIRVPEHVASASLAAEESLVLLKNESLLPLSGSSNTRILLSGPNAHLKRVLAGGWTLRWIPDDEELYPEYMNTVFDSLKSEFGHENVELAEQSQIVEKAATSDVIVMAVGELPYSEGSGNIYDLTLDREQLDWVKEAQATGLPVILIVIAGRPRIIREIYEDCAAVIWAGIAGI